MQIINESQLDFDDVLILPKRSNIGSRADVNLIRTFKTLNSKQELTGVPIVCANMDSCGQIGIAKILAEYKMFTCLHKFYDVNTLIEFFRSPESYYSFYTLGITDKDYNKLLEVNNNVKINKICIDAANGYTCYFQKFCAKIRDNFPEAIIIAGNVVTDEMVQELLLFGGVDFVKTGIGPGKLCQTRSITGCGRPQLQSIIDCSNAAHGLCGGIIADGGCRTPGDICKSFGAGADMVMLGSMLMGHEECEGDWEFEFKREKDKHGIPKISTDELVKSKIKVYGMSCYSDDTEILTKNGFKKFENLSMLDEIATLNPSTNILEYYNPTNIFKYYYSGTIINITSKHIDLCITENHNLYVKSRHVNSKFKLRQAAECYNIGLKFKKNCNWIGNEQLTFAVPNSDIIFEMDDWLDFFGFWLAEGCAYVTHDTTNHIAYDKHMMSISNNNRSIIYKYSNILKKYNIKHSIRHRGNNFELSSSNKSLSKYLQQFGKAHQKFIPINMKQLSKRQLLLLLNSFIDGDGSKDRKKIFTSSEKLKDDILEIALKCGFATNTWIGHKANTKSGKFNHNYNSYVISLKTTQFEPFIHKKYHTKTLYDGNVWCVEVPNHIVYVRRNLRTVWCGNSTEAMEKYYGGVLDYRASEGKAEWMDNKGSIHKTIRQILGGLRSCCAYVGAKNLKDLSKCTTFVRVTK